MIVTQIMHSGILYTLRISLTSFSVLMLILIFGGCNQKGKIPSIADQQYKQKELIAQLVFDTIEQDLGSIREGERVIAWFDYKNSGSSPLIIHKITAGCGCTVPSWKEEPLAPGEKETLKVVFDSSGKRGLQNIKITVYSNAENAKEELRIKALVKDVNSLNLN